MRKRTPRRPIGSRSPEPIGSTVGSRGCSDRLRSLGSSHEGTLRHCAAMVRLASHCLGFPVLRLSFDRAEFEGGFDGVWACASVLHVPRRDMLDVLCRLTRALEPCEVLYASFRYGYGETMRDGRLFTDYREETFRDMLRAQHEIATGQALADG